MPKERPDETPQEEKGYTPASPVKRTLAWIGLPMPCCSWR